MLIDAAVRQCILRIGDKTKIGGVSLASNEHERLTIRPLSSERFQSMQMRLPVSNNDPTRVVRSVNVQNGTKIKKSDLTQPKGEPMAGEKKASGGLKS